MSTTTSKLSLSRIVNAAPQEVFRAWTTPEEMKLWSCPEGVTVEEAVVDLRVGGRYAITMRVEENALVTASGVYRTIEAPDRLVYTWDWDTEDHAVGETLVTVEFRPLDGATEVVLTHDLFPTEEARQGHEEGWSSCLNRLETLFD